MLQKEMDHKHTQTHTEREREISNHMQKKNTMYFYYYRPVVEKKMFVCPTSVYQPYMTVPVKTVMMACETFRGNL